MSDGFLRGDSESDDAAQHGEMQKAVDISRHARAIGVTARFQRAVERWLGAREVAPPEGAGDADDENPDADEIVRPERSRHSARGDDERLPEGDDDEQPVALAKVLGVEVPALQLTTNRGSDDVENDREPPESILRRAAENAARQHRDEAPERNRGENANGRVLGGVG